MYLPLCLDCIGFFILQDFKKVDVIFSLCLSTHVWALSPPSAIIECVPTMTLLTLDMTAKMAESVITVV